MNTMLAAMFEYKAWANTELHSALEAFDVQRRQNQFEAMLRTLDHVSVVDQIFRGHLIGSAAPFSATQSAQVPSLSNLKDVVVATDNWYLKYVSKISRKDLKQRLSFVFTDGERGAMSREEMLMHVIAHGAYHRGGVGQMLEDTGICSPPDSLTKFLHRREPERRIAVVSECMRTP